MKPPIAQMMAPAAGPNKIPANGNRIALTLNVPPVPIIGNDGNKDATEINAAQTAYTAKFVFPSYFFASAKIVTSLIKPKNNKETSQAGALDK
jgi:hypothetical protein